MKNETTIVNHVSGNGNIIISGSNSKNQKGFKSKLDTKQMVLIAMLAALSYVLMLLHLPFKFLGFLEIEFSDIPALVAGLAYGPVVAVLIELIKNLIKVITNTTTAGVGELANFVVSASFMLTACFFYKRLKGNLKPVISLVLATIAMTIVGAVMNYYVMLPLYATFMGGMDNVVAFAAKAIPAIDNPAKLVAYGICPFNIFKGAYVSIIGCGIYEITRKALQRG